MPTPLTYSTRMFWSLPLYWALNSAAFAAASTAHDKTTDEPTVLEPTTVQATARRQENAITGYQAKTNASAVKTDTALIDLPQSISVITQDLINDQNMQSIADTLRYVPGMGVAQGEGNRDTPIFRGNSSTSDLFVDGIRDDAQYYRDLYNVERVDVLKGPNAMVFGRGGSGGLINRATKQADWHTAREAQLQLGSFDKYRLTGDINHAINDALAVRLTSLWEDAGSYRNGFTANRWGINPTAAWRISDKTQFTVGYEHFSDNRTADRGISSFAGRPVATSASTFFGDAERSPTWAHVDAFSALIDHDLGKGASLRNRTRVAHYDKFYQNVYPGAVNTNATHVTLNAYNTATQRENIFNQTDLTFWLDTGPIKHKLLTGMELGQQTTDNLRNTGYFTAISPTSTAVNVALANPVYTGPISFRQATSDANNHGIATIAAGYIQDQIELNRHWQAIVGVRYDRFEMDFINNRNGQTLATADDLVSPRGGLVFKPFTDNVALYANYSVAYVPRAGEQLSSLTASTQALKPEAFKNYEVGAKWDVTPSLSTTLAVFQLDRLNALATAPNDPSVAFLVDGQRTRGIELGISGSLHDNWKVMGGYAYQKGEITQSLSASALAGATLAQVPEHSASLWNRYDITRQWGVGLGTVYRSQMYAATDNAVVLPGFVRFDGALYYSASQNLQLQLNIENLLDKDYYASAHNNTNITPGSPIAVNAGVRVRF